MQIDWVTVGAQIVNFLVLIWLLHRFLYGPITAAMQRRENLISERFEEAAERQRKADQLAEELKSERHAFDVAREQLLSDARERADDLQRELEEKVRLEIAGIRQSWREALDAEREDFLETMRTHSAEAFQILASDALHDLADASLNEQMATLFLHRIEFLDDDERQRLARAAGTSGSAVIETGSELPPEVRRRLTRTIHGLVGKDISVDYRPGAESLVGIRLRIEGEMAEWSLDDYLDRYVERLRNMLPTPAAASTIEAGTRNGTTLTAEERS